MRLIDADVLKKHYAWWEDDRQKLFDSIVDSQPTVDAVPVKHSHWIPSESETGEGSNTYKCSACGEIQMLFEGTPKDNGWKYCPNCGADMRGEQDE